MSKSIPTFLSKVAAGTLSCVLALSLLAGCGNQKASDTADASTETTEKTHSVTANVAIPSGNTSTGLASFMSKAAEDEYKCGYRFAVTTSVEEILPALEDGLVDFAVLPPSTAAEYYSEHGGITTLAISSLSPISLVTSDNSISDLVDLADKSVIISGTNSEGLYSFEHLLSLSNILDSVEISVVNDPSVAVAQVAKEKNGIALITQPYAAVAVANEGNLRRVFDLCDVWDGMVTDGSRMVSSIVVARSEYVAAHPKVTAEFLAALAESSKLPGEDPTVAAPLVAEAGILDEELLVEQSLPSCHAVCITGAEMKAALEPYMQMLYDSDPVIMGDQLPGDDFYFGV